MAGDGPRRRREPPVIVRKAWGHEEIFASTDLYCGKFLRFQAGKRSSLHYHEVKDESWLVVSGAFRLELADGERILRRGDKVRLKPRDKHRLTCTRTGAILEVSTHDDPDDCIRIEMSGRA